MRSAATTRGFRYQQESDTDRQQDRTDHDAYEASAAVAAPVPAMRPKVAPAIMPEPDA